MSNQASGRLYWTIMQADNWHLLIAATDQGLCFLQFLIQPPSRYTEDEAWTDLVKWARIHAPKLEWVSQTEPLQPYMEQVAQFLRGERGAFTVPLDLRGTPFQRRVWEALLQIPHGHTRNYSEVAASLEQSLAVRAVGTAIGANPVLIVVPCHRVLGKNGALTGYRGGLPNKESLLLLEKSLSFASQHQ
ncbi:methylated-DNA--[protein]-cysteine S-methyltransferase [Paenibacillus aestuarii]|uniref:Methylated-DNA--[protein]-cysteine S-methyltransferase n=1 Tax=Paenibacillus aestuarii TaxID=516965 RepID=A0ABW0KBZ4_9BACL|nr:methylated-DNA--[protein]-cysteine S-methyltransferase [Paenibacillus aestuarii]